MSVYRRIATVTRHTPTDAPARTVVLDRFSREDGWSWCFYAAGSGKRPRRLSRQGMVPMGGWAVFRSSGAAPGCQARAGEGVCGAEGPSREARSLDARADDSARSCRRLTSSRQMVPPASICFPTRGRREYLAVALASVAPQAARARRRDRHRRGRRARPATAALADAPRRALRGARARRAGSTSPATPRSTHSTGDARVLPRRRRRGLARLARRAARRRPRLRGARRADPSAARGLAAARLRARAAAGDRARPRRRGPRRRVRVGREHGPAARRRSSASGRSTSALGGAGDEEDWQRRLRAAGGRVGYVAAAGVDHRRAGRDAQLRRAVAGRVPPRARRAPLRRRSGAPRRRSPPSCGRSPAASGTSCGAAAASGSR